MAENYFFNRVDRFFVRSVEEPTRIDPPEWVYGDTKKIHVTFVEPTTRGKVQVVTELLSAQLAIGTPGGSVLTSATATTATAAYAYPFVIPLNIAGINTFIGSLDRKQTTLEFLVTNSDGPNRYKTAVYLAQRLNSGALTDPPAGDSAMGFNQANGVFVKKDGQAGEAIILRSPSGYTCVFYYGDDKEVHFDKED